MPLAQVQPLSVYLDTMRARIHGFKGSNGTGSFRSCRRKEEHTPSEIISCGGGRMKSLPLIRLFGACLLLFAVRTSSAQGPATTQPIAPDPASPSLNRRIEVLIRSQFS